MYWGRTPLAFALALAVDPGLESLEEPVCAERPGLAAENAELAGVFDLVVEILAVNPQLPRLVLSMFENRCRTLVPVVTNLGLELVGQLDLGHLTLL